MSFLQPWMLAALPFAALPIIIHLINQRRYQTKQWAAMMFLLTANRMTRGYAKVRQWAILALRTLVIAALVIAIGRPLASGSVGGSLLGSMTGRGPANTIVLLDRSPSMQQRDGDGGLSKLETGVAQLSETLRTMGTGRVVLIESNSVVPRELESPDSLLELPQVGPSDASADLPAMMLASLDYIQANELGQCEVWICSDLREHDWRSKDGRWTSLREAFAALGRRVRFCLLAFPELATANRSVRVDEVKREDRQNDSFISVSLKIEGDKENSDAASQAIPVTIELDGARSTVDVKFDGVAGEVKGHRIAVPKDQTRGWGRVSIPTDTNPADDIFYFTFDVAPPRRTVIVTSDEQVARVLQLAAEIASEEDVQSVADVVAPRALASVAWEEVSLVLWHAPMSSAREPDANLQDSGIQKKAIQEKAIDERMLLQSFVDRGGSVIIFPPDVIDAATKPAMMFGMKWGSWNEPQDAVLVASWRGDADLLANTLAGASLPVGALRINRFVDIKGEATALATLATGSPLLSRVATPRGAVYICATTPRTKDSSLAADGVVLYVMIQRALQAGTKSLQGTRQLDAGEATVETAAGWKPLTEREGRLSVERAFTAGVYEDDRRWLAVNRSAVENRNLVLSELQIDQLFRGLLLDRVDQKSGSTKSLVEEVWRAFLILMLIAMIGEACLCLPRKMIATMAEAKGRMAA